MRRLGYTALIIALSLSLPGCALGKLLFGPDTTSLRAIQVQGLLDANQNMAATVAVVFVYDATALPLLPNKAADWFNNGKSLSNALGNRIDVTSMEVPPARVLDLPLPARYGDALTVYCYVNYIGADQGVTDLTAFKRAQIRLLPTSVEYTNR